MYKNIAKTSLCYKLISISPYAFEFHLSEFCIEIPFKEGEVERKKKKFLQDQPTEIKKKKIFSHAFHKFETSSPCITSYTRYKESIKNIAFDQFKVGRWKVGRIAVHVAKKIHWLLFQKRHSITWNVAIRIEAGASMCVKTLKQAWTARVSTDSASKDLPA